MAIQYIDEDFVRVRAPWDATVVLAFGDAVEVLGPTDDGRSTRVRVHGYFGGPFEGTVKGRDLPVRDKGVLKFSMVDVQQGDGLVLETPEGKVMLIDGGDNKLFARHVAARFRHRRTSEDAPLEVDAILVTHGDADHFDGLNDIVRSETLPERDARKRLFLHPKRVLHNGLVKAPGKVDGRRLSEEEKLGRAVEHDGRLYAVDLWDDPRDAPETARNRPFERWVKSLDHWSTRGPIQCRRVDASMDPADVFDFLHEEGIHVDIQGPFVENVPDPERGGAEVPALRFFASPEKSSELHLEEIDHDAGGSPSVSHTINGHSVALRVTYGNVRFCLNGDLNKDSMDLMLDHLDPEDLEAEIVKAPHHGSHEFDFAALAATKPVVAIISSGDEKAFKEHIHPRATLMAALGKVMRGDTGVVFCTELAAFFAQRQYSHSREDLKDFFGSDENKDRQFTGEELRKLFTGDPKGDDDEPKSYYGFERTNFGIVHVRTDGERVLVFTHSGKKGMNEAYRFEVDADHRVTFAKKTTKR